MKKHPPKTELVRVRMTKGEREMLRTLAIRHATGSDSGYLRWLIRQAWERRTLRELSRERGTSTEAREPR